MKTLLAGLVLLLAVLPVQAHETVQNELIKSEVNYIYIYNRADGSDDLIVIFNDTDLTIVCSIDGVTKVTVNNVSRVCKSD